MYVDSMESYAVMNKKYCSYFGINPPVRVCVGVSADMFPDSCRLVLCGVGTTADHGHTGHLHVQGVSHWAPANIGPYSQGKCQAGRVLLSGSIGLVPGLMTLVSDSEAAQAGLALRHVARAARVVAPRASLSDVTSVTCYVTSSEAAAQADMIWKSSEDFNPTFPVQYLLVSELPRGAKVEWELELQDEVVDSDNDQ